MNPTVALESDTVLASGDHFVCVRESSGFSRLAIMTPADFARLADQIAPDIRNGHSATE